jgi:hypothetical protein
MSQEKLELVQSALEGFVRSDEATRAALDEEVLVHDHSRYFHPDHPHCRAQHRSHER